MLRVWRAGSPAIPGAAPHPSMRKGRARAASTPWHRLSAHRATGRQHPWHRLPACAAAARRSRRSDAPLAYDGRALHVAAAARGRAWHPSCERLREDGRAPHPTMSDSRVQVRSVLDRGLDDWVHITEVIDLASQNATAHPARSSQEATRNLIRTLIGEQYCRVGKLSQHSNSSISFEPYSGSESELIDRALSYLESVEFRPSLDGDWWFSNTAKGDAVATGG